MTLRFDDLKMVIVRMTRVGGGDSSWRLQNRKLRKGIAENGWSLRKLKGKGK